MENIEDSEKIYIVYIITNQVNKKIYIGKTKLYYGNNSNNKYGIIGRLKTHLRDSRTGRGCPLLQRAIDKYGAENFTIRELERTTESLINDLEIFYISLFDATNHDIGYNIALGGKGRSVVNVSEKTRKNISLSQNPDGIMGIHPICDDEKNIIGYRARRKMSGKQHEKYFTKTTNSVEENLRLAQEWLQSVKNGIFDSVSKYNKNNDLPQNISYIRDKKDKTIIIGYRVFITIDGKLHTKSFQSKTKDLPILLNEAIEYKNNFNAK